ncbi:MAG TPA: tetratricopeptide repeat protein [Bryobacteraceae bacterium]|nr:tetratricopeptide repeat protein [Bryobacteraceae bacterium]
MTVRRMSAVAFVMAAGWAYQTGGPQLIREGKLEEALEVYARGVEAVPKSVAANNGAGVVLDLLGRYAEARKYFSQAVKRSPTPLEKALAQRALAISYGFSRDCRGAEKSDREAYEYFLAAPDFYNAGEVANELGRICLDAGDWDIAYTWYQRGHEAGLQEENIAPARKDLWDFRWAHARARIAIRRGKPEEARKYIAAARAILGKGTNAAQQVYFPFLTGYVAFYAGDYRAALADLQNAQLTDPFIQCLIAQSYEKLGDRAKALEHYRMAANTTAHSVPAAFARPFARSKLE